MCTVTYIPHQDGIYLTSNRDEKTTRATAIFPSVYGAGAIRVVCPKDPKGKGTWIGAKNTGTAAVLLNGGFVKHHPKLEYGKSRGLIFMEVMLSRQPRVALQQMDLSDIEPFTLIIFEQGELNEFRWDGESKHEKILNAAQPHIWSSATLYNQTSAKKRKNWFENWMLDHPLADQKDILDFHRNGGDGNAYDGLLINRSELIKTVSISCLGLSKTGIRMNYFDLKTGTHDEIQENIH
jgi:hypothetical protein